jgi:hypothetical protein
VRKECDTIEGISGGGVTETRYYREGELVHETVKAVNLPWTRVEGTDG